MTARQADKFAARHIEAEAAYCSTRLGLNGLSGAEAYREIAVTGRAAVKAHSAYVAALRALRLHGRVAAADEIRAAHQNELDQRIARIERQGVIRMRHWQAQGKQPAWVGAAVPA